LKGIVFLKEQTVRITILPLKKIEVFSQNSKKKYFINTVFILQKIEM